MRFTRIYLDGKEQGKLDKDDFVIGYRAEDGQYIDIVFVSNNVRAYAVKGDRSYGRLADAKAACERMRGAV